MVRVAATNHIHVQADSGVIGDRLKNVPGHGTGEVATDEMVLLTLWLALVDEVGASRNIDDGASQRLVNSVRITLGTLPAPPARPVPARRPARRPTGTRAAPWRAGPTVAA